MSQIRRLSKLLGTHSGSFACLMIWCRRSRRRPASACPDGSRAGGDPRAQQLFHFILGYIHGAPLVRNGVPFALVKSPLDLDGLRDEATGICRSKLRTCPSRCTIRQPSGCRNAGIDSISGSANLQGVRARARKDSRTGAGAVGRFNQENCVSGPCEQGQQEQTITTSAAQASR